MKCRPLLAVILVLLSGPLGYPDGDADYRFALHLIPSIDFPIGESRDRLLPAAAVSLLGEYRLGAASPFSLGGGIGYSWQPVRGTAGGRKSLSIFSAEAGLGVGANLGPAVLLGLFGSGGYYLSLLTGGDGSETGSSPLLSARGGLRVRLGPRFGLSTGVSYRVYFSRLEFSDGLQTDTLLSGISSYLGLSYFFTRPAESGR